jgi:hypothetical protein
METIMKFILIGMLLITFSFNTSAKEENGGLNGEIFRGVMQDTLLQFNYHRSQTEFLFADYQREESFFKSFGERSYQGVINTKTLGKVEYVTKNAKIFWESRNGKKESSTLDMNEFLYEHHPALMQTGVNRFICGGLCIGAIAIGIGGVSCAIWNQQCNNRCNAVTCPTGSSKVCESSCATTYCGVACNHFDASVIFNPPWASGGAWNAYPFTSWNQFQLDDDPTGSGQPSLIGN